MLEVAGYQIVCRRAFVWKAVIAVRNDYARTCLGNAPMMFRMERRPRGTAEPGAYTSAGAATALSTTTFSVLVVSIAVVVARLRPWRGRMIAPSVGLGLVLPM